MCNRIEKPCQLKKNRKNGGFSLIELSIVLIVVSLLIIPLIRAYDIYKTQKIITDTKFTLGQASQSLTNFYEKFGRYPCPADRSIRFGEDGHGVERCTELLAMGNGTCAGGGGYCRAGTTPDDSVFIGGLPYVTMDIPMVETIDGWKNKFTYAVTASMADDRPGAVFDPDNGAVSVVDEFGVDVNEGRLMHGVVLSAGMDGVGAFSLNGNLRPCVAGTVQSENCDNDTTFVSSYVYEAEGPTHNDDFLFLSDWSRNSIWAYSPEDGIEPGSVYNTNTGNIGIGTERPDEKLHVVGNIKSDEVHSTEYCNADGEGCMSAETIGGDGTHCTEAGQLMFGIDDDTARCRPVSVNVQTESCPAGRYVIGISNNRIVCSTP